MIETIMAAPLTGRQKLDRTLRVLAKWRSQQIGARLAREGLVVRGGPFAGMSYLAATSDGGVAPRLLGSYEAALHPFFAEAPARGYAIVLNVGCAEGFYAVGCARLLKTAQIIAWDIDEKARTMCAHLARNNGVEHRIDLRERFVARDVDRVREAWEAKLGRQPRGVLVMDCEGAEFDLLDPGAADFRWLDLVVEVHPAKDKTVESLASLFRGTHDVEELQAQTIMPELPAWLVESGHLDQLMAVWEWRAGPTPWLVMRRR
jgi:predicted RNA methylase